MDRGLDRPRATLQLQCSSYVNTKLLSEKSSMGYSVAYDATQGVPCNASIHQGGDDMEEHPSNSQSDMKRKAPTAGTHGWDPPLEAFQTRGSSPYGPNDTLKVLHYKSGTATISILVTVLGTHSHSKTSK